MRVRSKAAALAAWTALFVSCVFGAWAWFKLGGLFSASDLQASRGWLSTRTNVPGYVPIEEPLSTTDRVALGATAVWNGKFVNSSGDSFRVLSVASLVRSGKSSTVLNHTPDGCWPQTGFRAVDLGQPGQVPIRIGRGSFPFQCRVFRHASENKYELVLWCTQLAGRVFPEAPTASSIEDFWAHSRASLRNFLALLQTMQQPFPNSAEKRFFRCSVSFRNDWNYALEKMLGFLAHWLSLAEDSQ